MNRVEVIKKLRSVIQSDEALINNTSILLDLKEFLKEMEVAISDVAKLINREPSVAAIILKFANSSLYGQKKKISSLKKAITVIGLKELESIITTNFLNNTFNVKNNQVLDEMWKHSLGTAIAAKHIMAQVDPKQAETAFSIGLLHDIGKFIIEKYLPDEFSKILDWLEKDNRKRIILAEKKVLGLSHQDIGAFFAKSWNFPEVFQVCLKKHHSISSSAKHGKFLAAIFAANHIAKGMELGSTMNPFVYPVPKWMWHTLGFKKEIFRKIIPEIQHNYNIVYATMK